jgi:hypothetical protein
VIDPLSLLRSAARADQQAEHVLKEKSGSEGPPCPNCGHATSRVLQGRAPLTRDEYKRRRECVACRQRFTTYESIAKIA